MFFQLISFTLPSTFRNPKRKWNYQSEGEKEFYEGGCKMAILVVFVGPLYRRNFPRIRESVETT